MRYLLLFLTLTLQLNLSSYNAYSLQENCVQKTLTSENTNSNERSDILFRYYDSETGTYLSQDPIGLEGGFSPYSYVHEPNSWVDVFGLSEFSLPKTVKSAKGIEGVFSEKDYHYRIDTNKVATGEGGFHIHIYKGEGTSNEVAKTTGRGGFVKTHEGKTLKKPNQLPKSVRKEIRKLTTHTRKKIKQC